ncbi:MAG: BON domain-containing protein [Pseudomonadota bacterium]
MRPRPTLAIGISCVALLTVSGCVAAAVGAVGAGTVATFQERSVGQAIDDATTSNEIKAKLLSRGGYGEVDIEVNGGLVLLTGRVISPEMRVTAERVAWTSSRVDNVANQIQIEPPGGFRANANDAWITTRVRSSLVTSRRVRGVNYNIETYNGVVYLMGIARSQEELETAAERASYVRGVQQVVSYVTVRDRGPRGPRPAPILQADAPQAADGAIDSGELLGASY